MRRSHKILLIVFWVLTPISAQADGCNNKESKSILPFVGAWKYPDGAVLTIKPAYYSEHFEQRGVPHEFVARLIRESELSSSNDPDARALNCVVLNAGDVEKLLADMNQTLKVAPVNQPNQVRIDDARKSLAHPPYSTLIVADYESSAELILINPSQIIEVSTSMGLIDVTHLSRE